MQQNAFWWFRSPPPPPVCNPLLTLISSHSHTLTGQFRLVMRIQSARLSSFHTPTVRYMGQTGVMASYRLINCQDEMKSRCRNSAKFVAVCVFHKSTNKDFFFPQRLVLLVLAHTHTLVWSSYIWGHYADQNMFSGDLTVIKQNLTSTIKWLVYWFRDAHIPP